MEIDEFGKIVIEKQEIIQMLESSIKEKDEDIFKEKQEICNAWEKYAEMETKYLEITEQQKKTEEDLSQLKGKKWLPFSCFVFFLMSVHHFHHVLLFFTLLFCGASCALCGVILPLALWSSFAFTLLHRPLHGGIYHSLFSSAGKPKLLHRLFLKHCLYISYSPTFS